MILVFDSSPLIYFARSGVLAYINELEGEKYIPSAVYGEVVTNGRAHSYPDAEITDHLIRCGIMQVKIPGKSYIERLRGLHEDLHPGELEVLALSHQLHGTTILDDRIGREIGKMFQIEVRGSAFILFVLVRMGVLHRTHAAQILRIMVSNGFRIGTEQYAVFLDLIGQIPDVT
jgi:predicted nucleic acid-binding protein